MSASAGSRCDAQVFELMCLVSERVPVDSVAWAQYTAGHIVDAVPDDGRRDRALLWLCELLRAVPRAAAGRPS